MAFLTEGQEALQPGSDEAAASLRDDSPAASLGDSDMIVRCLSYLSSQDLASVALVSRAYGGIPSSADVIPPLSLVEKTARQICTETTTADERAVLPKYSDESWLELLHNLEIHRGRLVFQQLIGTGVGTDYVEGDKARLSAPERNGDYNICTAICNEVMRAGRHFATVEICSGTILNFGVIRPIKHWDRRGLRSFSPFHASLQPDLILGRTERWGSGDVHCCMYWHNGDCDWTDWEDVRSQTLRNWEGLESYDSRVKPKVGLLLDLNEGTLTAYNNGRRLGVMKNGLSGVYSWSIQVHQFHDLSIQRLALPGSQIKCPRKRGVSSLTD